MKNFVTFSSWFLLVVVLLLPAGCYEGEASDSTPVKTKAVSETQKKCDGSCCDAPSAAELLLQKSKQKADESK